MGEGGKRASCPAVLLTALLSLFPLSPSAAPADLGRDLEDSKREQQALEAKATRLAREMQRLSRESIAAAESIHGFELELDALERDLEELEVVEKKQAAKLEKSRRQTARVLMALQRMARFPPEALVAQSLSPDDLVRSAILLRAAVPGLEEHASRLRADLNSLRATRREVADQLKQVAAVTRTLSQEKLKLDTMLQEKSRLRGVTDKRRREIAVRVAALSRKAKNLGDLVGRIDRDKKARAARITPPRKPARGAAPEAPGRNGAAASAKAPVKAAAAVPLGPPRSFRKAKGTVLRPVAGRLIAQFGEGTDAGLNRKGITLSAREGSPVVSPWDGEVVFAGKFRGYGQLLIIEHSEGYHSLLAGLARIDGTMGQSVRAGEPIGTAGRPAKGEAGLYYELRRDGRPINPLPWLTADTGKAKG